MMTDQQRRIHARANRARDAGRMEEYFKLILLAGEAKTIKDVG
jgi:hypothetical protein